MIWAFDGVVRCQTKDEAAVSCKTIPDYFDRRHESIRVVSDSFRREANQVFVLIFELEENSCTHGRRLSGIGNLSHLASLLGNQSMNEEAACFYSFILEIQFVATNF